MTLLNYDKIHDATETLPSNIAKFLNVFRLSCLLEWGAFCMRTNDTIICLQFYMY
jgi:hypothetical protein